MAEKKLLILRLEGPLQAWDDASKWDERGTWDFPSKSGVVGLIGCAMGLGRGSPVLEELNRALIMAVRADRIGTVTTDFQTVTGSPLRNAEGKPKTTGNTLISRRAYLQDACFTVVLEMSEDWHKRIVAALSDPKWCMYLGRKTCVPSRPILECAEPEYADLMDALRRCPPADRAVFPMPFETEVQTDALSDLTRADSLVRADRGFARRRVWKGLIEEDRNVSDEA